MRTPKFKIGQRVFVSTTAGFVVTSRVDAIVQGLEDGAPSYHFPFIRPGDPWIWESQVAGTFADAAKHRLHDSVIQPAPPPVPFSNAEARTALNTAQRILDGGTASDAQMEQVVGFLEAAQKLFK